MIFSTGSSSLSSVKHKEDLCLSKAWVAPCCLFTIMRCNIRTKQANTLITLLCVKILGQIKEYFHLFPKNLMDSPIRVSSQAKLFVCLRKRFCLDRRQKTLERFFGHDRNQQDEVFSAPLLKMWSYKYALKIFQYSFMYIKKIKGRYGVLTFKQMHKHNLSLLKLQSEPKNDRITYFY